MDTNIDNSMSSIKKEMKKKNRNYNEFITENIYFVLERMFCIGQL